WVRIFSPLFVPPRHYDLGIATLIASVVDLCRAVQIQIVQLRNKLEMRLRSTRCSAPGSGLLPRLVTDAQALGRTTKCSPVPRITDPPNGAQAAFGGPRIPARRMGWRFLYSS